MIMIIMKTAKAKSYLETFHFVISVTCYWSGATIEFGMPISPFVPHYHLSEVAGRPLSLNRFPNANWKRHLGRPHGSGLIDGVVRI